MANILRRAGVEVPESFRRLLEGDLESWLRVEEYREGDQLVVKAEVPGIDPERDVDITVNRDQLQIVVRREEKSEQKSKDFYRSEFRYGTFSRTVALPSGVQQDDVRATYNDGVLEVRIPVPDESPASARKVPVVRG
jgi:HSP20 family protein